MLLLTNILEIVCIIGIIHKGRPDACFTLPTFQNYSRQEGIAGTLSSTEDRMGKWLLWFPAYVILFRPYNLLLILLHDC